MKRALALLLLLFCATAHAGGRVPHPELVYAVDPFIGTGGHGHTFPGPALPLGMVKDRKNKLRFP